VAVLADVEPTNLVFVMLLGMVIPLVSAYVVGKWIGARCERKGWLAVVIAALFVPVFDRTLSFIFYSREELSVFLHASSTVELFFLPVAIIGSLFGLVCLLGYWQGQTTQLSRYLTYLLRALPEASRDTLVHLAYDEATRLAPARAKTSSERLTS
jgi:hypothetical protein